jgi:hypothetical protein
VAEWIAQLPALVIVVPLTAAPLAFLARQRGTRGDRARLGAVSQPLALVLAVRSCADGTLRYQIGGWGGPLGIDLVVDGLSATMLLVTSVVGLAVTVYALGYFADSERTGSSGRSGSSCGARSTRSFSRRRVQPLRLPRACEHVGGGTRGLTCAGTLSSPRCATCSPPSSVLSSTCSAWRSSMARTGVLDIATVRRGYARADVTGQAAFALITVGLMLKTALFPLHFWLPPAHSNAPSPVSAVLSALVVKGSFYILVRLWIDIADPGSCPDRTRCSACSGPRRSCGARSRRCARSAQDARRLLDRGTDRLPVPALPARRPAGRRRRRMGRRLFHASPTRSPSPRCSSRQAPCSRASGTIASRDWPGSLVEHRSRRWRSGSAGITMMGLPPERRVRREVAADTGVDRVGAVVVGGGGRDRRPARGDLHLPGRRVDLRDGSLKTRTPTSTQAASPRTMEWARSRWRSEPWPSAWSDSRSSS